MTNYKKITIKKNSSYPNQTPACIWDFLNPKFSKMLQFVQIISIKPSRPKENGSNYLWLLNYFFPKFTKEIRFTNIRFTNINIIDLYSITILYTFAWYYITNHKNFFFLKNTCCSVRFTLIIHLTFFASALYLFSVGGLLQTLPAKVMLHTPPPKPTTGWHYQEQLQVY